MAQETASWHPEASRGEELKKREKNAAAEFKSVLFALQKHEITGVEVLDALDKALFLLTDVHGEEALQLKEEIEELSERAFPERAAPYESIKEKLKRALALAQPVWELKPEHAVNIKKELGNKEARA
jgi:hypothetical protein